MATLGNPDEDTNCSLPASVDTSKSLPQLYQQRYTPPHQGGHTITSARNPSSRSSKADTKPSMTKRGSSDSAGLSAWNGARRIKLDGSGQSASGDGGEGGKDDGDVEEIERDFPPGGRQDFGSSRLFSRQLKRSSRRRGQVETSDIPTAEWQLQLSKHLSGSGSEESSSALDIYMAGFKQGMVEAMRRGGLGVYDLSQASQRSQGQLEYRHLEQDSAAPATGDEITQATSPSAISTIGRFASSAASIVASRLAGTAASMVTGMVAQQIIGTAARTALSLL